MDCNIEGGELNIHHVTFEMGIIKGICVQLGP